MYCSIRPPLPEEDGGFVPKQRPTRLALYLGGWLFHRDMQDAQLIPGTEALTTSDSAGTETASSPREAPCFQRPERAQAVLEP